MTMENYDELALRTESPIDLAMEHRVVGVLRLLHAIAGKVTEAGEMMDQLKKHIFYGKELDVVNLIEEAGDDEWYGALLRAAINEKGGDIPYEYNQRAIQEINVNKLRKRYPNKYTHENAVNRDLEAEREVLETKSVHMPPSECQNMEGQTTGPSPLVIQGEDQFKQIEEAFEAGRNIQTKEEVNEAKKKWRSNLNLKTCPDCTTGSDQTPLHYHKGNYCWCPKCGYTTQTETIKNLQKRIRELGQENDECLCSEQSGDNEECPIHKTSSVNDRILKLELELSTLKANLPTIELNQTLPSKKKDLPPELQFTAKETTHRKRRYCGTCGSSNTRTSSMYEKGYVCQECGKITIMDIKPEEE